jgi:NAD(P)-dependent dehydrogenase (short-subunit alcohol dehydrogenase family)
MRKPVVLITGAGGEIGHGLVTRLAAAGSPIITLDVSPLDASLARWCGASSPGRSPTSTCSIACSRSSRSERSLSPRALLSTRSEFTPVTAHHVNVEGHAQPARVRAA